MQLNGDDLKRAFRAYVVSSPNPARVACPRFEQLGAVFEPGTDEAERLDAIDHSSRCLPCARELAAARLVRRGHDLITPMLPEQFDASDVEATNVVAFPTGRRARSWVRPTFALAAAASLAVVFVAGALLAHFVGAGSPRLVAIAPIASVKSSAIELSWEGLPAAARYDVTMSWPSGKVFCTSDPIAETRFVVPESAVAQMKRGQTCLWTLRALDGDGREIARETFSFVVEFDPPRAEA